MPTLPIKPQITVSAGVLLRSRGRNLPETSVLLTRRPAHVHLAGLWEFPGGKRHGGESLEECLARELMEELGIGCRIGRLYHSVSHEYPEKIVHLNFFLCDNLSGIPVPHEAEELAWVPVESLHKFELPPADKELVSKLKKDFSNGKGKGDPHGHG